MDASISLWGFSKEDFIDLLWTKVFIKVRQWCDLINWFISRSLVFSKVIHRVICLSPSAIHISYSNEKPWSTCSIKTDSRAIASSYHPNICVPKDFLLRTTQEGSSGGCADITRKSSSHFITSLTNFLFYFFVFKTIETSSFYFLNSWHLLPRFPSWSFFSARSKSSSKYYDHDSTISHLKQKLKNNGP